MPDDIPFLNTIDSNFTATGTTAIDTSEGMLRGRPYGGVALEEVTYFSACRCCSVVILVSVQSKLKPISVLL